MIVTADEAKACFGSLLDRVEAGEEIAIARRGTIVARLVPVRRGRRPELGLDVGRMEVPDDFDEPLPPDVLDAFSA